MKILILIIISILSLTTNAQTVKWIKNPVIANHQVFVTKNIKEAHLVVFKVNSPDRCLKAGLWYEVENPQLFKSAITLYKVNSLDKADLIIYYTNDPKLAGYRK
jgi:hypothetical protein